MEDKYIIITINGQSYYIEASRVYDLSFINGKLVNISNSSITLVSDFDYSNSNNTYPRITCNAMSQCSIRSTYNSNSYGVTSKIVMPQRFNMNTLSLGVQNNILIGLLIILLGVKLLWKH